MGCLEAFPSNTYGAKHRRNVISHVDFPRNVSRENVIRPVEVQKYPKNNKNWKLQYTLSDLFETRALNVMGCLIGTWEVNGRSHVAWNEYVNAFMFISRQFWVSQEMNK